MRRVVFALWCCGFMCMFGCADPYAPATAPVDGRVLLDGKPLADALVSFTPRTGSASEARTDAEGRFTLAMKDGKPGAVVGRHEVRVVAHYQMKEGSQGVRDFDSGDQLVRDVQPGSNDFTFVLHPTIDTFQGRLTWNGAPLNLAQVGSLRLILLSDETGESFGVPLRPDASFQIGWMPIGKHVAILARSDANLPGGRPFPGLPGTFTIPSGVTIEPGQTDYTIELGEEFSPQRFADGRSNQVDPPRRWARVRPTLFHQKIERCQRGPIRVNGLNHR